MEKYKKKLALTSSYLLHPLLMPTIGMLLVFYVGNIPSFNPYSNDEDIRTVYIVITSLFIATGIFPIIIGLILKKLNYISNLHMPKREERIIPFIITCGSYLGVIYLYTEVLSLNLDPKIYSFIVGATLAIITGLAITLSWKISLHMIGIGGIVGMIVLVSKLGEHVLLYPLILTILTAGIIAFGRLFLKAHNIQQVIAGFFLGFFCEIIPLMFLN